MSNADLTAAQSEALRYFTLVGVDRYKEKAPADTLVAELVALGLVDREELITRSVRHRGGRRVEVEHNLSEAGRNAARSLA